MPWEGGVSGRERARFIYALEGWSQWEGKVHICPGRVESVGRQGSYMPLKGGGRGQGSYMPLKGGGRGQGSYMPLKGGVSACIVGGRGQGSYMPCKGGVSACIVGGRGQGSYMPCKGGVSACIVGGRGQSSYMPWKGGVSGKERARFIYALEGWSQWEGEGKQESRGFVDVLYGVHY